MPDQFKNALRNSLKQIREHLSQTYQAMSSKQICTRLITMDEYKNAEHIALYHAVRSEIDLSVLFENAISQEKRCYYPALNDNQTLSFLPVNRETLFKTNRYGIPEPDVSKELAISVNSLDLILMPLLAFDIRCTRLGMGAGYYDRTLEHKTHPVLIGVGYQFQRVDFIEAQPWDVPLDGVITQNAVYWKEPVF